MSISLQSARTMCVADIMQKDVFTVPADMRVTELARELTARHISGAPVVNWQGEVTGVVSVSDIAAALHIVAGPKGAQATNFYHDLWSPEEVEEGFLMDGESGSLKVHDIMTPVLYVVEETESVASLLSLLLCARIHRAVVTRGNKLVGIVTTMDVIRLFSQLLAAEP